MSRAIGDRDPGQDLVRQRVNAVHDWSHIARNPYRRVIHGNVSRAAVEGDAGGDLIRYRVDPQQAWSAWTGDQGAIIRASELQAGDPDGVLRDGDLLRSKIDLNGGDDLVCARIDAINGSIPGAADPHGSRSCGDAVQSQ
jgi:hypothetical protein